MNVNVTFSDGFKSIIEREQDGLFHCPCKQYVHSMPHTMQAHCIKHVYVQMHQNLEQKLDGSTTEEAVHVLKTEGDANEALAELDLGGMYLIRSVH